MDMVWKKHAEVSYNYVGTYAIMLYCNSKAKGEDKYDDHKNTDGAFQVAESCLKKDKDSKDYDACFNEVQQKAINKYRYEHEVDAVQIDKELAAVLYEKINDAKMTAAEFKKL
jgi:hypothetical protein